MNRIKLLIGAAAAALTLSACGGGAGGDGLAEVQREDRAASVSVAGLIAFANGMIAMMTGEANEPRSVDGVAPPSSDTDEPAVL